MPTGSVDGLAKSAAILAVDLNESIPLPRPEAASAGSASTAAVAAPGASTPDDNPYMPTRDTGSVAFKQAHTAWDGRGVTVGVIDSGVDLDHPALQTTSTGERKIVDWVTGTHPLLEGDGSWRAMLTSVTGPTFTYAGATWTAPEGSYKINRVAESISTNSDAAGDFNRDGDKTDAWGVLRRDDPRHLGGRQPGPTFSADEMMRPYKERFDVGHFGTDNPATAIAESMPFVVEYREDVDLTPAGINGKADFVNIGVVESAHGTHVAGIAAGHSLFGGEMDGQAPGHRSSRPAPARGAAAAPPWPSPTAWSTWSSTAASTSSTCRSAACPPSTTATTPGPASTTASSTTRESSSSSRRATAAPASTPSVTRPWRATS